MTREVTIHLSRGGKAVCGRTAKDHICLDTGSAHGSTMWPWITPIWYRSIADHLCGTCERIAGDEFRRLAAGREQELLDARRHIPERILEAVKTASGGNRTVVRCEVPGYSSRFSDCVKRIAREEGLSIGEVGRMLVAAGITHVRGLPIPQQWSHL